VMLDQAGHYFLVSIQGTDCPLLIFPHETAITLYICTKDGSKFSFNFLGGHGIPL
jgi:hypothetical protein